MFANLSILGLYNYDDSIFDNMVFPSELSTQQKEDIKTEILSECSDFTLIYPDFPFMKTLIGVWSRRELPIWEALYKSTQFEYDPIENYNRYEENTRTTIDREENSADRTGNRQGSSSKRGDATSTADSTGQSQRGGQSAGESVNGQTAFNSNDFKDVKRATSTGTETESSTDHNTGTSTAQTNETGVDVEQTADTLTEDRKRTGAETVINHMHGNIGVTTTQQMIREYRDVSKFDIDDYIVDSFKARFCIQVY